MVLFLLRVACTLQWRHPSFLFIIHLRVISFMSLLWLVCPLLILEFLVLYLLLLSNLWQRRLYSLRSVWFVHVGGVYLLGFKVVHAFRAEDYLNLCIEATALTFRVKYESLSVAFEFFLVFVTRSLDCFLWDRFRDYYGRVGSF